MIVGKWASSCLDPSRANPWKRIEIDPDAIEWTIKDKASHHSGDTVESFHNITDAGNIVAGDWDQRAHVRYSEFPKYKAVHQRYNEGVAWEDTGLFDHLLEGIDKQGSFDGCQNLEDLQRRYMRIDEVYESIRSDGLLSRSELCKRTDVRCLLDVPKVNIARDGTFIHQSGSGNHRVAIASVLDIGIEVRVVVRHEKWQEIREEIVRTESKENLSERARERLDHPDLADVVPGEW